MDTALFNMNLAYGFDLNMTKAQRLEMGDSAVSSFDLLPRPLAHIHSDDPRHGHYCCPS